MFWVIFDTSTKRDYYRDVHNLLALPPSSTIRYDYRENLFSAAAVAEARKGNASAKKVLLAYAQANNFEKGDDDPVSLLPHERTLWIGTRIANLSHLHATGGRYYFDLEVLGYPTPNEAAFMNIMRALSAAGDTPFERWVAMSDLEDQFAALTKGETADNWAAVVNRLGNFPSQFAGDSFWRIAKVANGASKINVSSTLRQHYEVMNGEGITTGVEAVFPIFELDRVALQIQSRLPERDDDEPTGPEPEAVRTITFATSQDGPIAGFNGKIWTLRRYEIDWIESDVSGSDRIDTQIVDLTLKTGPSEGGYPIGPELSLRFQSQKKPGTAYLAMVCAIGSVVSGIIGGAELKDNPGLAIALIIAAPLLMLITYYLWTGRVKLPGGK
jgi:hypothetical protein